MHVFSRGAYRAFFSIFAFVAVLAFAPLSAKADVKLLDMVLTTGVMDREPVDTVSAFRADGQKAYVYARVKNTEGPEKLTFVWYLDRVERARVQMLIGTSIRWRTWSSSMVGPGNWRVDLLDQSGRVIGMKEFAVGNISPGVAVAPSTPGAGKSTQ